MGYKKIFCVIPALNEEKTISGVLKELKKIIYNIIVVDDGSTDRTAEIVRENGAIVLSHIVNRGQGAALATGNEYALARGADIIFHFDADGQFSVSDIPEILNPLIKGEVDVVLGSRFLGKKSNMPAFKRAVIIPIARLINFFLLGAVLTDPQCGFRALSAAAWKKISLSQDGMAHCSEIIAKIFKTKLRVREIPVAVRYSDFGQHFGGGVRILKDLFLGKLTK